MTKKQDETLPQVEKMLVAARQGDLGTIGTKECIRNQLENWNKEFQHSINKSDAEDVHLFGGCGSLPVKRWR